MRQFLLMLAVLAIATTTATAQTRKPAPAPPPPTSTEANPTPAPTSALDGEWRGTSDGGSCNAPLDYVLTIENGFVDGSSYDTTARGPVPNPSKQAPPAPTPGLWQIHGVGEGHQPSPGQTDSPERRRPPRRDGNRRLPPHGTSDA
jgi:hypothetical protein